MNPCCEVWYRCPARRWPFLQKADGDWLTLQPEIRAPNSVTVTSVDVTCGFPLFPVRLPFPSEGRGPEAELLSRRFRFALLVLFFEPILSLVHGYLHLTWVGYWPLASWRCSPDGRQVKTPHRTEAMGVCAPMRALCTFLQYTTARRP